MFAKPNPDDTQLSLHAVTKPLLPCIPGCWPSLRTSVRGLPAGLSHNTEPLSADAGDLTSDTVYVSTAQQQRILKDDYFHVGEASFVNDSISWSQPSVTGISKCLLKQAEESQLLRVHSKEKRWHVGTVLMWTEIGFHP